MDCRNCNTSLNENSRFCSNCGEIINANRLRVKSIIGLFFSNFFSFDNKFARTFKDLTVKPEIVIDSYVSGYRRKYINVIGYLGLAITLIGFQFFILRRFFPELLIVDSLQNSSSLKVNNENIDLTSIINSAVDSFYQYQGLLSVILIPVYALASKLLFLDIKKYNLAEHFVINIYINAHFYIFWIALTLITLPFKFNYNLFSGFAVVPMLIYMTYTFKKLYNLRTFETFFRVLLQYVIISIATIAVVLIFAIGYGFYLGYTGQITPTTI